MINNIEDYELSYNLFLAEQDMFRSLSELSNTAILEGATLVSLQEGVKETIMTYLKKIMDQIQKVWNGFKSKFTDKITEFLDKKVKPIIDNKIKDVSFTVENFVDYDMNRLRAIKVAKFNYNDQTKETMQTEEAYIKATYANLPLEGGTDIKAAITKAVAKKIDKYEVGPDQLREMFGFCKNDLKNDIDDVSNAINELNASSKDITNMVSTVTTAQEAYNTLAGFGLIILSEETGDNNRPDNNDPTKGEKMSFSDTDTKDANGNVDNKSNTKITKAVTVYMSVSTQILSTKMKMILGKFNSNVRILTHLVKYYAGNKKPANAKEAPTTAPTVDTTK